MCPDHGSSPRPTPDPFDPLSTYTQLVVPSRAGGEMVSISDTLSGAPQLEYPISSSLVVESLDDLWAEQYPLLRVDDLRELRAAVELFISTIWDEVSRDYFLNGDGEFSAHRPVAFRYGPARLSSLQAPLAWIEVRCQDTEAYLLPSITQGVSGARWLSDDEHRLPERFHDGPARLVLELDPRTKEVARCHPLISPQCAFEAESNFIVSIQRGENANASYLLSHYHDRVIARAVEEGCLSPNPSNDERRTFLRGLSRPRIAEVSGSTDGERTISLAYPSSPGGAAYTERITLRSIPFWGVRLTGVTKLQEERAR